MYTSMHTCMHTHMPCTGRKKAPASQHLSRKRNLIHALPAPSSTFHRGRQCQDSLCTATAGPGLPLGPHNEARYRPCEQQERGSCSPQWLGTRPLWVPPFSSDPRSRQQPPPAGRGAGSEEESNLFVNFALCSGEATGLGDCEGLNRSLQGRPALASADVLIL